MDKTFLAVLVIVTGFTAFLIGYSVPPYIEAGVFSDRKELGVQNKIDPKLEQHYKDLYKTDED